MSVQNILNSKWIKKLNIRSDTLNLRKEKVRTSTEFVGTGKDCQKVVIYAFSPRSQEKRASRCLSSNSLVYKANFRTARDTQRNVFLKNKKLNVLKKYVYVYFI